MTKPCVVGATRTTAIGLSADSDSPSDVSVDRSVAHSLSARLAELCSIQSPESAFDRMDCPTNRTEAPLPPCHLVSGIDGRLQRPSIRQTSIPPARRVKNQHASSVRIRRGRQVAPYLGNRMSGWRLPRGASLKATAHQSRKLGDCFPLSVRAQVHVYRHK